MCDKRFVIKLGFVFGHFLNDVCACMWFTYLLVYQQYIMNLSSRSAGLCLLIGQVADGISTLFVGIESDKIFLNSKYGQKKLWHLFGTILIIGSFIFIFSPPLPFKLWIFFPPLFNNKNDNHIPQNNSPSFDDLVYIQTKISIPEWVKLLYYIPFIVIFQFAWACVQISHLSLIPRLSSDSSVRVELTSIRYASTVTAYVITYLISWNFLHNSWNGLSDTITPQNMFEFQNIAFDMVVIGGITSIIFHVLTVEPVNREIKSNQTLHIEQVDDARKILISSDNNFRTDDSQQVVHSFVKSNEVTYTEEDNSGEFLIGDDKRELISTPQYPESSINLLPPPTVIKNSFEWLCHLPFYQNLSLYMLARLSSNVSMAYIPLYLLETQHLNKTHIAIIPLIIYLSGFVTAFCMKRLNIWFGRKPVFTLGTVLTCVSSFSLWFLNLKDYIYWIAVGLGIGTSTLVIVSLSLTADLIGNNIATSSFVYGFTSLADKFANGIVIYLLQKFYPSSSILGQYFRTIMAFVPSGTALAALLILFTMHRMNQN